MTAPEISDKEINKMNEELAQYLHSLKFKTSKPS